LTSSDGSTIQNVYDADGNKLKTIVTPVSGSIENYHYQGGVEYQDGNRQSIHHESGRIVYNGNLAIEGGNTLDTYAEWQIADHLGNVRVRFVDKVGDKIIRLDDTQGDLNEVTGTYHYYPFGMKMEGNFIDPSGVKNKYQYNGIEQYEGFASDISFAAYRSHSAALGCWMQVDPKAEGAMNQSPYNSMWNNPISNMDPNGDFAFMAALGYAALSVTANGIINEARGGSFFDGAAGAAFAGAFTGGIGSAIGAGVSGHLPSTNINLGGGFNLSLSPAIAFGSGGIGLGANAGLSYSDANFSAGVSFGASYFSETGAINTTTMKGESGLETRLGWGMRYGGDGFGVGFGGTSFGGIHSQQTGHFNIGTPNYNFTFENDVHFVGGDGGDRYRTAGVKFQFDEVELGLLMYTGDPGLTGSKVEDGYYVTNKNGDNPDSHRMGALYFGIGGYRLGYNSEEIRDHWQNRIVHKNLKPPSPYFTILPIPGRIYGGRYTNNPHTVY
jgi:RHS repeat-associated protein